MVDGGILEDVLTCGGSGEAECGFCKRVHFARGCRTTLDAERLEELEQRREKEPDKYIPTEDDGIAYGFFDGRQVVWGCECRKIEKYEQWIWDNRDVILRFIKERNDRDTSEAARVSKMMAAINDRRPTQGASP